MKQTSLHSHPQAIVQTSDKFNENIEKLYLAKLIDE